MGRRPRLDVPVVAARNDVFDSSQESTITGNEVAAANVNKLPSRLIYAGDPRAGCDGPSSSPRSESRGPPPSRGDLAATA